MEHVFNYCERGLDPGFWAEPANALTNLAFIAAGLLALQQGRRTISLVPRALAMLVIVIGIGSFLFHTFANGWSSLADVIPIGVFMLVYFGFALRRFLRAPLWLAILGTLGFAGLLYGAQTLRCEGGACYNGSAGYLPALAAMLVIGGGLLLTGARSGATILAAGGVFAVSLTLRTIDRMACSAFPPGTHFAWHLLNALMLYLLLRAAFIKNTEIKPGPAQTLKPR